MMSSEKDISKIRSKIVYNKEEVYRVFDMVQTICHDIAIMKGWHDKERSDGEYFALFHCEISEATEHARVNNPVSEKIPAVSGIEEELADEFIRIFDYAQKRGYNVGFAVIEKILYNLTHEYRNGNKVI